MPHPQIFTAPPPGYMPSHDQHKQLALVQNPDAFKLHSPGLSNGSSSTPDTHNSAPLVTPEDHPQVKQGNGEEAPPTFTFREYVIPQRRKKDRGQDILSPKDDPAQEEARRNRSLEKNRIAATKCRQKKKEWMSDLEEKAAIMERKRSELLTEKKNLRAEANQIKSQLMEHGNCHDPNIDKWVENEAKRWVLMTGDRYDQMLANMNAPAPQQQALDDGQRTDSFSSNSTASGYPIPTPNEAIGAATSASFPPPQVSGNIPFAPPNFPGPPQPLNLQHQRLYRGDGNALSPQFPQGIGVDDGTGIEVVEDQDSDLAAATDDSDDADSVDFDQISMTIASPEQQHQQQQNYVY